MLFVSAPFLFAFLPVLLILYFFAFRDIKKRNCLLFFFSLFFYAWGEPWFVLVMLFSILVNWFLGRYCEPGSRHGHTAAVAAVAFNILLLFVYKYLGFVTDNLSAVLSTVPHIGFALPIGISFFTFQEISYILDIRSGKAKHCDKFLDTGLYIAFFPQLIAGPIIRYEVFAAQVNDRRESWEKASSGAELFCIGFAKKILLANTFARLADYSFALNGQDLTAPVAWLGALAYTFQIYFDFSGYSDMAIGLARIFGFEFPINFNYPYISKSISEFWRRWHISMGSFFRDYVYFPMGGSRVSSRFRLVFNLFTVWALTGIWHGANWTFLLWGLYFFVLIGLEKLFLPKETPRLLAPFQWLAVFLLLILGWVMFRAETYSGAWTYLCAMFRPGAWRIAPEFPGLFFEYLPEILLGFLASVPVYPYLEKKFGNGLCPTALRHAWLILLFLLGLGALEASSFNPFIYFNF